MKRRQLLLAVPGYGLGLSAFAACRRQVPDASLAPGGEVRGSESKGSDAQPSVSRSDEHGALNGKGAAVVLDTFALGAPPWTTFDPFLFCVHHDDDYPLANAEMGPAASLEGRNIGSDFAGKDGWSMYHGDRIPGFPRHPHRGFETVTVTRQGFIDHSDSMGATARYGGGDVQWMTAGRGIVHAEMFPLLEQARKNPAELFQIWLNLPRADKFVEPHFSMFWHEQIPRHRHRDPAGRVTEVTLIAGAIGAQVPPRPPPSSWAARVDADVAIWSIRMAPGASFSLPATAPNTDRTVYFFRGREVAIGGQAVSARQAVSVGNGVRLARAAAATIVNSNEPAELLLLSGRPIDEPIIKRGPFVMNSQEEIRQAFDDYRATGFGGWPWSSSAPVHARTEGRFAIHADGRKESAG